MRDEPVTPPTAALTTPAWPPAAASAVNFPPATVPFRPSSVHVASVPPDTGFPFASKSFTVRATASPGLTISSVGVTSAVVAGPAAAGAAGFTGGVADPDFGVPFGPMA